MLHKAHILSIAGGEDMDKHHIVFKSQGGLDFDLNFIELPHNYHIGDNGPHKCRETDLKLKIQLQNKLEKLLYKDFYAEWEVKNLLGIKNKKKIFKSLDYIGADIYLKPIYRTEDIIRRLMGGKLY